MMYKTDNGVGMFSAIRADERWMIELVLNQNIKPLESDSSLSGFPESEPNIIRQVRAVIAPGQADDLNAISLCAQIFHQFAVVHISAAECVERAVDYKADFH